VSWPAVLQPPPTKRSKQAAYQAAYRQRKREKKWMYGLYLKGALVDEAMDRLLLEGLQVKDRYDRKQIAVALSPVIELCLRQIRDRKLPAFNLFGRKR
jgi:hypothetical protein